MDVKEVAAEMVALMRQAKFEEAVERFYGADIVSMETARPNPETRGYEAVKAKGEWFAQHFDVHSVYCSDPYIHGDQFAVVLKLDATEKTTGKKVPLDEIALYTVKDGKITYERFYLSLETEKPQ